MVVPPETPTCHVKGIIRGVAFEDEVPSDADQGTDGPPGAMPGTVFPAHYRLTLLIQEVSYISGDVGMESCEERYAPDTEGVFFLYLSSVRGGDAFHVGQVIEGRVWYGFLRSYELTDSSS